MTGATVLASPTPEPFCVAHRCKRSRNKSRFVSLAGWKGASSCILQQGAPQGRTKILCDDERTLGRGWGCAQLSTLLVWYKINRTNWSWSTSEAVGLQEPRRTTSEVVETLVYVWLWYPPSTRQTAWKYADALPRRPCGVCKYCECADGKDSALGQKRYGCGWWAGWVMKWSIGNGSLIVQTKLHGSWLY